MDSQVLIAIPVFNGRDALVRCLDSLISSPVAALHRVLLLNDASSDAQIAPMLETFTRVHASLPIEVRHNRSNRGFTWNVNQAIAALHANEHLLLLNSDTQVTDGWLDEMLRTLKEDGAIGTVTPFSNNATICSLPDFSREWPLPSEAERARLARVLAASRTAAIDLPTAVGFCMLISRACLDAVGRFDVASFPRGYGEENDFCRRAAALGFRNVLCPNAFVAHEGGQSFSEEKAELMRIGGERLLAKHPNYNELVSDWIARDPVKARREDVAARLR